MAIDPGLNADLARSFAHFENESFFGDKRGERVGQDGIRSQPQERRRPCAPPTQIDQPRAERQQQACGAGGEEHIRTRPQRLIDWEKWTPGVAGRAARYSGDSQPADSEPWRLSVTQKLAGQRSQKRSGNRG